MEQMDRKIDELHMGAGISLAAVALASARAIIELLDETPADTTLAEFTDSGGQPYLKKIAAVLLNSVSDYEKELGKIREMKQKSQANVPGDSPESSKS